MAGWAHERGTRWQVLVGTLEFDLLVERKDINFLRECARARYSCWVSRLVVMTRHTRMMVPNDISVYFAVEAGGTVQPPSSTLGRMLTLNTHLSILYDTWEDLVSRDCVRSRRVVHPLAMLAPPKLAMDQSYEVSLGYIFRRI